MNQIAKLAAQQSMIPNALSIAGVDPGGGAGILADVKVFSALGVFGCAIPTSLTAQNTREVSAVHVPDIFFFRAQLDAFFADIEVHALKLGMLANAEVIKALSIFLKTHEHLRQHTWVVCDPVMVSKSGHALLSADAVAGLIQNLIPLCDVITPNLPEAYVLLGQNEPKQIFPDQMPILAIELYQHLKLRSDQWLLLKGGHAQSDGGLCDYLCQGANIEALPSSRIHTKNTHGTGCSYSAALTALLAKQKINSHCCVKKIDHQCMLSLVKQAQTYIWQAIKHAHLLQVGHNQYSNSHGPLHHFYAHDKQAEQ